ncbi:unnamed protein product [Protopolystoma xenopodis]|uniref:Uncharacterized protein n=1 Tax=Protopolystoma xenopodis TaxID=117903 RepID=A0A448WJA3_9PLAT|nr:unnamed protein product [Protopolystoma xenopodis]
MLSPLTELTSEVARLNQERTNLQILLDSKAAELLTVSGQLAGLRNRLLEDNQLQYLEQANGEARSPPKPGMSAIQSKSGPLLESGYSLARRNSDEGRSAYIPNLAGGGISYLHF